MIALSGIVAQLIWDGVRFVVLALRPRRVIQAENLFLRRQLALYKERGVKARRVDPATRVSLALLARLFDWRTALMAVRPETLIRWHRAGFRLLWRWKAQLGRPPIPLELRELIRRMATENPLWGEERIANELLLKLGVRVSPRTVRKYMPKRPPGRPRGDQRWSTFLRNHARAIVACDFFVAVTVTFRLLYVFVLIEHGARRLLRINVTRQTLTAFGETSRGQIAECAVWAALIVVEPPRFDLARTSSIETNLSTLRYSSCSCPLIRFELGAMIDGLSPPGAVAGPKANYPDRSYSRSEQQSPGRAT